MGSSGHGAGVLNSLFSCNSGEVFTLPCFQGIIGEDCMQQEVLVLLLQVGDNVHQPLGAPLQDGFFKNIFPHQKVQTSKMRKKVLSCF